MLAKSRPGFRALVVGPDQTHHGNGHGALEAQRGELMAIAPLVVEVLHGLQRALAQGPTGPTFATTAPTDSAYLTLPAALERSGLSYLEFRRAVQAGEVKVRGRRYRRADVERL